jgi:hypothetical protein
VLNNVNHIGKSSCTLVKIIFENRNARVKEEPFGEGKTNFVSVGIFCKDVGERE